MSFPLGYTGPLSGIVLGTVFGYVLENAGFGSGCKLTAQLRFQDWAVFKVMFTAIVVASGGLYLLQGLGLVNVSSDLFVPSVFLWGSSLGGVLIGAGMAIGGYCPGTSLVAFCSGRVDGLVFLLGIVLGTLGFNSGFASIRDWAWKQVGPDSLTLPQLLHLPVWAVWALLLAVLLVVGYLTRTGGGAARKAA
ncbi:MAG: YeeE/YedE family protein [Betaproteobacteria bacterium]|nr:YeeE/YedE family protein [Betaproteobacteria bacterium]MBU6511214.1 YeeE/YedE family protein [Betaproteobacteria bacterium]MDE1957129.1 YeeE/YedE family protein [Betaproteobacteria bacterium]MDE2151544.1 YeeE/YedE family protein [Betaproteobacteria bacterium]MDE2478640.1 YeeE/YedE family protein [Betaproteobacteria bacterium]